MSSKKPIAGQDGSSDDHLEPLRTNDFRQLSARFAANFDESRAIAAVRRVALGDTAMRCVGEGTHQKVYELKGSQSMSLAIAVAKGEFKAALGPSGFKQWRALVKSLARMDIPMIPPLAMVDDGDLNIIAMPLGVTGHPGLKAHWLPLEGRLTALESTLARKGYRIDDVLQVLSFEGVPFVCDLSDLKATR